SGDEPACGRGLQALLGRADLQLRDLGGCVVHRRDALRLRLRLHLRAARHGSEDRYEANERGRFRGNAEKLLRSHEAPRSRYFIAAEIFSTASTSRGRSNESVNEKMLPSPTALSRRSSPPIKRTKSRQIVRPRPVPPNFRVVLPSACVKLSNTAA